MTTKNLISSVFDKIFCRKNFTKALFLNALFLSILFLSLSSFAQTTVTVDVGEARARKSLLALTPLIPLGAEINATSQNSAQTVYDVIANNLDVSGFFTFIKPEAYPEDPKSIGLRPKPNDPNGFDINAWRALETEYLIRGGYRLTGSTFFLEMYVYNIKSGELLMGKKYESPTSTLRKLAHTFSNDFVKAVTGKDSFFLHPIVVSQDKGPKTHREIFIMDWDGANPRQISFHRSIALSPDWSPDGQHIAYTAFVTRRIGKGPAKKNADLFMYEPKTGRRWLVSYRDGINSGANFLRSSKELLLTLSIGGNADIYRMSSDGKRITQITRGPGQAMNVEPAISPDGSRIAFSSDRSGRPMIFVMNSDGSGAKQLTFAGHYNSTPSWSPDGKKIAFAGVDRSRDSGDGRTGAFDIFLINVDGTGLKRLTTARKTNGQWANNEAPSFAPDGQRVLFVSDRTMNSQLYMVNIDGTNERRITHDQLHYSRPKWGPKN